MPWLYALMFQRPMSSPQMMRMLGLPPGVAAALAGAFATGLAEDFFCASAGATASATTTAAPIRPVIHRFAPSLRFIQASMGSTDSFGGISAPPHPEFARPRPVPSPRPGPLRRLDPAV